MNTDIYETEEESDKLRYSFVSKGEKDIVKLIAYSKTNHALTIQNEKLDIYNLAFGDKKEDSNEIDDKTNSNNGDMYKVFNTVLHTIPYFFEENKNVCLHVVGSDIRRAKAYSLFVSRHFDKLEPSYTFYGFTGENKLVPYVKGEIYAAIVFFPKKP